MRNHFITCHIEGEKPVDKIQDLINYFTVIYIEDTMKRVGLSKDQQIAVLSEIIQRYQIRENDTDDMDNCGR
ncbi:MAG: hypothetical protein J6K48_10060 [Lachnospiraceae bacterium]|nr:hypothetical protein [Lachnospiraceae bacterium]